VMPPISCGRAQPASPSGPRASEIPQRVLGSGLNS
jgi:hypothetical protein